MKVSRNGAQLKERLVDIDDNFLSQEEASLKQDIKLLCDEEKEDSSSVEAAERIWKKLQQLVNSDKKS